MPQGYDWDVWPRDLTMPRVKMGSTLAVDDAIRAVEMVLAADDSALLGTVDHLPGRQLQCRRGDGPGSYVWRERALTVTGTAASGDGES